MTWEDEQRKQVGEYLHQQDEQRRREREMWARHHEENRRRMFEAYERPAGEPIKLSSILWIIAIGHVLHFLCPFVAKTGGLSSQDWVMTSYLDSWSTWLNFMSGIMPPRIAWIVVFLLWGAFRGFFGYGNFFAAIVNRLFT